MDDMNFLTDLIADKLANLVYNAIDGNVITRRPQNPKREPTVYLTDACVELACDIADMVTMRLTAPSN